MKLRHSLMLGIAGVLMTVGAITAGIGGYGMQGEVHELLDQHLVQIARLAMNSQPDDFVTLRMERRERPKPDFDASDRPRNEGDNLNGSTGSDMRAGIGGGMSGNNKREASDERSQNEDTELIVQRWQGDQMINLLSRHGALPQPTQAGFSDIEFEGRTWKSYARKTNDGWVAVAQPAEARNELINGAILMAILPSLLALPLAGWVLAWLIRRGLEPLQVLSTSLEHRPAFSTEPLASEGLPQETQPLVAAFNKLLMRVNLAVKRERDFITDAAHTLRTPIAAVQLQAESLQEARSKADYTERLQDLIAGIARGRHTVEQLLTLARAERPSEGKTEIHSAIQQAPARFHAALKARNLTLQLELAASTSIWVPMSEPNVNIVIDNLLDNAIRYSLPDEDIVVSIRLLESRVQISVRDYGLGLSPRELERVFDRFYRPSNDTTTGTGLGLAIVRALCETAGGRVWLELPIDRCGMEAIVELPLRQ